MPPHDAPVEIVVFRIRGRESKCSECGEDLGCGRFLRKDGECGLCMDCSDLGDLVFLPRGDPALTRRSSKYSPLRAVVVEWSRSRKRYERQGILVSEEALAQAEKECLDDGEAREQQRMRNAERREVIDAAYIRRFSGAIRDRYPAAPAKVEEAIAAHACRKYSGRVGRSAAAKELDPEMIDLAVIAWIRHQKTDYDQLLTSGIDRGDARAAIRSKVDAVLREWREG
jgi:hypothetical protein